MNNKPVFFDPLKKLEGFISRFLHPLPGTFILVSFQYAMLAIAFVTILMWTVNGFDSTLHFWAYEHNLATAPDDMFNLDYYPGIGIHWSTLFTIAFCAMNLSLYLKTRLEIDGFINILYSLLIGWWVAMMVFEVPYVFFMEWFHNNPFENIIYPIWLAGHEVIYHGAGGTAGSDATKWFVIASLVFPIEGVALYVTVVRKYLSGMVMNIGYRSTKLFYYITTILVGLLLWLVTASLLSQSLYPVIIRNFTWLFGFILAHGLLVYEFNRPNRNGNPRKFSYRFKSKVSVGLLSLMALLWLVWIYYPLLPLPQSPQMKGFLFPQTVYAWYDDVYRVIIRQRWIENNVVHFINIALKGVVAFWTCYVFAPKVVGYPKPVILGPREEGLSRQSLGETEVGVGSEGPLSGVMELESATFEVELGDIEDLLEQL